MGQTRVSKVGQLRAANTEEIGGLRVPHVLRGMLHGLSCGPNREAVVNEGLHPGVGPVWRNWDANTSQFMRR